MTITNHPFDIAFAEKKISDNEQLIEKLVSIVEEKPKKFSLLYQYTMESLSLAVGLKRPQKELTRYASLALNAITNHMLLAQHNGKEVILQLPSGKSIETQGLVYGHKLDCANWVNGFYLAALLRNQEALHTLSDIPLTVFKGSELQSDDYYYNYVAFLQNLIKPTQNAGDLLIKAYEGTAPELLKHQSADYVLHHEVPQLDLWTSLLSNDTGAFNQQLSDGLNFHKQYWNRSTSLNPGGQPISEMHQGYFSLPLTGIAALATDKGMIVEVASDYMPLVFVSGN